MFYVYTWTDPRCGSVFYVGKGTKSRAWAHLAYTISGRGANATKISRVQDIVAARMSPSIAIVAEYEYEGDAYEHERDLIASTSGLTNVLAGHGWKITREEAQRREGDRKKRIEARKAKEAVARLKGYLAMWDKWPDVVFPNIKNGVENARQYVRDVRAMVAAYEAASC